MKKYPIVIKSSSAEIVVYFQNKFWLDKFKKSIFLKTYIPACQILSFQKNKKYKFIFLVTSGKNQFIIKNKNAIYSNNKYSDEDIITLIEMMLEKIRQANGEYCMHSSSVIINNKGIIFWGGASGMGKTRLALFLSKVRGAIVYSDEKTLINLKRNIILGGVHSIYVSKQYLKEKYGDVGFLEINNSNIWRNKEIPISFMVYPFLESKKSFSLEVEKWSIKKFDWHLYEELSRKIRGTSRRIFNNTVPVPSFDDAAISLKRSLEIKKYVIKIPCYYIRGNEKSLSKKILKIFNSEKLV